MSCTDKTQPLLVQLWTERATRFEVHDHRIGICNLPQILKQFQLQEAEDLRDRCFLKFVDPRFGLAHASAAVRAATTALP